MVCVFQVYCVVRVSLRLEAMVETHRAKETHFALLIRFNRSAQPIENLTRKEFHEQHK